MKKLLQSNASKALLKETRKAARAMHGAVYSDTDYIKAKFHGRQDVPTIFVEFLKQNFPAESFQIYRAKCHISNTTPPAVRIHR